jgi:lysozyme
MTTAYVPLTMRLRRPLLAIAFVSAATSLSAAVAAGCSMQSDAGESTTSSIVAPEAADATDSSEPRRVCPSGRNPDGSWVVVDGIDISDYKYTDWDEVVRRSPNQKFAFARVSAGLVRLDSRFFIDWPAIKRVGLIRGAYQYFKPSQSAIAQADLYLRRIQEEGGLDAEDFPPVFDLETTNDMPIPTVLCRARLWLSRVERATKRLPLIYTSAQQNALLGRELRRYPLWIANYVGTPSRTCPRMPDAWDKWALWQWSEGQPVKGVYTNANRDDDAGGSILMQDGGGGPVPAGCDVNYYDGTLSDLRRFIASTVSPGDIQDPPPLENPPVVPGAGPVGAPIDCTDGCCVSP